MVRPTIRVFLRFLAALAAGLLVFSGFAAWRLSQGPVSLSFLTPVVEKALNSGNRSLNLRLSDTRIFWQESERRPTIRFIDARVVDADGVELARVPQLSLTLNTRSLIKGVISPRKITVYEPRFHIHLRDKGYEIHPADSSASQDLIDRLVTEFSSGFGDDAKEPKGVTSDGLDGLETLEIIDAALLIEGDANTPPWVGSVRRARLWRTGDVVKVEGALEADDGALHVGVEGEYDTPGDRLDMTINVAGLRPATFSRVTRHLAFLEAVDVPISGTAALSMGSGGAFNRLEFNVSGDSGHLALPAAMATELGLSDWAQRLPVEGFTLRGQYDGEHGGLNVELDRLDVAEGGVIAMPDPIDHDLPLHSVRARGRYNVDRDSLEIAALEFDLNGPKISLSGTFDSIQAAPSGQIHGSAQDLPVADIPLYWPRNLSPNPYDWITTHLADGGIKEVDFDASVGADDEGNPVLQSLKGAMSIAGVTVDYLPPLPKVRDASGSATFDMESFTITVTRGEANGVTVTDGTVAFLDLDTDTELAALDVTMHGTLPDIFRLIDHEPLGYAREVGIEPDATQGTASVALSLRFPLLNDLTLKETEITATAKLQNAGLDNAVLDRDMRDGDLALRIDQRGLDIEGRAAIEGISGTLKGRENFNRSGDYQRRFQVMIPETDLSRLHDAFFKGIALPKAVADGAVRTTIKLTEFSDNSGEIQVGIDFAAAAIELPVLGWTKVVGDEAHADIQGRIDADGSVSIPRFEVVGNDLSVIGRAALMPASETEQLEFRRIKSGRTDAGMTLTPSPDGSLTVRIQGKSLDINPFWDQLDSGLFDGMDAAESGRDIALSANLDRLWLAPDRRLNNVVAAVERRGDLWTDAQIGARFDDGSRITAKLDRIDDSHRVIAANADNAGTALATLGIFSNMEGGRMTLDGAFDDTHPSHPMSGRLQVNDYRILKAPMVTRILSAVALTGLSDALSGNSLTFSNLVAPFTLTDQTLRLEEARATGLSIGFTANGSVDLDEDQIDISGTVVPIYSINAALGRIPIVGDLLTGGEKGGGIFAANFSLTGSLDNPDVSVNPLSALTPSYLRRVFGFLDSLPKGEVPLEPQSDESP